jgi:TonB family protein
MGLFAVIAKSHLGAILSNEIIIYLQDGSVIKCDSREKFDYVDSRAKAVYSLTDDQLNKMKNSNIHTVRYTLVVESDDEILKTLEWNWSASNKGIPTKTIITDFLEGKVKDIGEYSVDPANSNVIASELEGSMYNLTGRKARVLSTPKYDSQSEGTVVVEITVDRNGNVTKAVAGVRGTTTIDQHLLQIAKEAALGSNFDRKPDAPSIQMGTITYHFKLR